MSQLSISYYYNTTSLTGNELKVATETAATQDERVYRIFQRQRVASPSQVLKIYNRMYPAAPLTSIRRSVNTLTKEGKLDKRSDVLVMGLYGRKETCWRIKL